MKYPSIITVTVDHSSWRTAASRTTLTLGLLEKIQLTMPYIIWGLHGGVWVMTACSLVGVCQCFGESCYLLLQG
jgi:hypothetical protein